MIVDQHGTIHRPAGTPAGGQFAGHVRTAPEGALTPDQPDTGGPLILDRSRGHTPFTEQVRPLLPAYRARRAQLEADGANPLFKEGFMDMPQIAANTERDRESIIYYLSVLDQLEREDALEAEFVAAGGRELTREDLTPGTVLRGTIVQRGQYVGGVGWQVWEDARLVTNTAGNVYVIPRGKRTNGFMISPATARSKTDEPTRKVLFRPEKK